MVWSILDSRCIDIDFNGWKEQSHQWLQKNQYTLSAKQLNL